VKIMYRVLRLVLVAGALAGAARANFPAPPDPGKAAQPGPGVVHWPPPDIPQVQPPPAEEPVETPTSRVNGAWQNTLIPVAIVSVSLAIGIGVTIGWATNRRAAPQ
jgi:hypothetical protein